MTTIKREYVHKTHGKIGEVELIAPDGEWKLNGKVIPASSAEYFVNFALQCFQDAYAGSDSLADAQGAFNKRVDNVTNGTIGVRGGGGTTDVEKTIHRLATARLVAMIESAKGKDAAKAFRDLDKVETDAKVRAFIESSKDVDWTALAEADIARRKAEAEERAKQIADAMNAVNKAKIDLDAILKG